MSIDARLAKKGRSEPIGALAQQGHVSVELAKRHATELISNGWAATSTDALASGIVDLQSTAALKADAAGSALHATREEQKAIDAAKAFIGRLRNVLPLVLRSASVPGVDAASFRAGTKLGRSTPVISKYLTSIRAAVVKLDAALKPYFMGAVASAELDKVKTHLDAADAKQEAALAGLPAETMKVYEMKGRVLELIEDLNRVAKNAFEGNPEVRGKFNKDILTRARGSRKLVPAPGPVPVPMPTPGPAVSVPPPA